VVNFISSFLSGKANSTQSFADFVFSKTQLIKKKLSVLCVKKLPLDQ